MKLIKIAVLAGAAATVFAAGAPADATWYSNNRGTWGGSSGWGGSSSSASSSSWGGSSGWGSSGWGSSGWGSSGWGSSGWGSSGHTSSTSGSTGSTGGSTGGTSVPEPSNLLMLGLGVVGLVAGRYAARRRRKKNIG